MNNILKETFIRCFIGIFFQKKIQFTIEEAIESLLSYYDPRIIRWIQREQFHITLRFLGATSNVLLPALNETLAQIAQQQEAFLLTLKNLAYFPHPRRPQVLAFETDLPLFLINLNKEIEKKVQELGFAPEKRVFKSHITLARFKSQKLPPLPPLPALNLPVQVQQIALVQSQTESRGSQYSTLANYSLRS